MKNFQKLFFVACISIVSFTMSLKAYEQKSIKQIVTISADSINNASYLSDYLGDTVVVRGTAQVSVLLNATGGDRRPLMLTGKSWLTYISSSADSVGIAVFQRDTLIRTTSFDKVKSGDSIEFTAIVTTLPYEFDAFSQRRLSMPALEIVSTSTVKTLSRNLTLDKPLSLAVSTFYSGTKSRKPQFDGRIYAGRKVSFDSLVVSVVSPQLTFADSKGNEITIADQSGNFTTKNHYIEESMFTSYTVGQKIYNAKGYITTNFVSGSGGGGMGGGSNLYSFALAPALVGDITPGPKPAVISVVAQRPTKYFPSSKDNIEIIYDVLSGSFIVPPGNIALNYSVDGGLTYTKMVAEEDVTGSWVNRIPAQKGGTVVRYFISAIDEKDNFFRYPVSDEYYYRVVDTYPTIADIKKPDTINGIKNTQGTSVTIEGIVMCDSNDIFGDKFQNPAKATIQDGIGPYSGASFSRMGNNSKAMQLVKGQKVRLLAKLQEWNNVMYFSSIDSIEVLGTESLYSPVSLSTTDFTTNPGGSGNSDQWRDMLVQFNNVNIAAIEPSAPQLSGEFVIVDEALKTDLVKGVRVETDESKLIYTTRDSIVKITSRVIPSIGENIDFVRGIVSVDFRTRRYKLIPRFDRDFSRVTSVNEATINEEVGAIFPNPVQAHCSVPIKLQNNGMVNISIVNSVTGAVVSTINDEYLSKGEYTIALNTQSLNAGVYLVKIRINDREFAQTVSVLK